MTLQEAHEIQRRELISLRHKVAKLEKQVSEDALPISVKAELEHEIRSRDREIVRLKKELRVADSKYDHLKKIYDLAKDEAFESSGMPCSHPEISCRCCRERARSYLASQDA